jgi:hypothetical protein
MAIGYSDNNKILIEFQDPTKYQTFVFQQNFRNGNILNPYFRRVFGVGYVGEGPYLSKKPGNRKYPQYQTWSNMIMRCYRETYQASHSSYVGCSVSDEWHNYQNFAKWWDDNYYSIPGERMDFDKDLLFKGNRIYAPDKCCIIPHKLNLMFIKRSQKKKDTPTGVLRASPNKFYATYGTSSTSTYRLGPYKTVEDAFLVYKNAKETSINEMAEYFKDSLPRNVYNAAINWKVEITD